MKMCSRDVHGLNLGLCFHVPGRGQPWWLSQCQLFGAHLGSRLHDSGFQLCSAVLIGLGFLVVCFDLI